MATSDTEYDRNPDRSPGMGKARTVRYSSGTNIAAGIWLLIAPFLLGYSGVTAAVTNSIIIGVLVLAMAWYRTANPAKGIAASWTNAVLGVWLVIAPFALGYSATGAAVANDIIVGLVVLTLGAVSAVAGTRLQTATAH